METDYKKIFYAGMINNEYPPKEKKLKKTGLSLRKLERAFPYLLGEGRGSLGKLQIYFSLLPEYAGKTLLGGKPKIWKPETAKRLMYEAGEKAYAYEDCTEQIIAVDLNKYTDAIPIELWAAWLYQQRPFDSICVSLSPEEGEQELRQLTELIAPYLPRMKKVVFRGEKSQLSEMLEDYLYEEFGIVMIETGRKLPDMPNLNLNSFENRLETVKFLDTAVKNGYNTEVD